MLREMKKKNKSNDSLNETLIISSISCANTDKIAYGVISQRLYLIKLRSINFYDDFFIWNRREEQKMR